MNKKDYTIIRIISWSVIALALLLLMIFSIKYNSFRLSSTMRDKYDNYSTSNYSSGNNEIDGNGISNIDINWIDGSIDIATYDGDKIKFYEEYNAQLDEKEMMHYYSGSDTLYIEYSASKRIPISIIGKTKNKHLTVLIPQNLSTQFSSITLSAVSSDININGIDSSYIDIDNVSGELVLSNAITDRIDIDSTSGNIYTSDLTINKEANIDTLSGDISLNGSITSSYIDTTSGNIDIISETCPKLIECDNTSGDISLTIPENEGFTYSVDKVGGNFKSDFPTSGDNEEGVYLDGGSEFSFSTISGNVGIYKL